MAWNFFGCDPSNFRQDFAQMSHCGGSALMTPNVLANVATRHDISRCPKISRQMSRHVEDTARPEISANVEKNVATSMLRATRNGRHAI